MRANIFIRVFRKKIGLSQEALSRQVGVSLMTVRRWEAGEREPRASDITKLCEVLGCSESELINGPQKKEFRINIVWLEKGDEDVENLAIKANDFNVGIRSDGSLLLWGEIPLGMTANEVGEKVRAEVAVAEEMRALRDKRLRDGKA
jgi:transcriptional regulator with XRE-family HTH domain